MSFIPPGEVNPFEAPRAGIGAEARFGDLQDNDADLIRREHLSREANIKSIGSLYYLGAVGGVFLTILYTLMAAGVVPIAANDAPGLDPSTQRIGMGVAAVFSLLATALNGALGYGLTKLQTWARWTVVVFTGLSLLAVALYTVILSVMVSPIAGVVILVIGGGINGLILWILVSKKAGVVFSREYKEIILKTPHIKQKMSIIVKILVGFLVAVLLLIAVAGLISYFANR